jgi:glycosyltransferase involved in cell wall biosynthesis
MLDIYILSSRSEGLGTSLIEAGACGCPLIASDCGGPKDLIEHGRTGFLFPIEDDKELHSIVGRLLDNPQERESVTTCFAETIDRFSVETVCEEIVSQYNRLALLTG